MQRKKCQGIVLSMLLLGVAGCDDNTGNLGLNTVDPNEIPKVRSESYELTTHSILADSVYSKTRIAYLGKFTDNEFGTYECDFMTEFKCVDDFEIYYWDNIVPAEINGTDTIRKVEDIQLVFTYTDFFGDSINPCRLSIYPLNDKLQNERHVSRYTNFDISQYHQSKPLKQAGYMVYDPQWNPAYYREMNFQLPDEVGNDILDKYKNHKEYFKDQESFIKNVFPGVYVKTDIGDGTILYINFIDIRLRAHCYERDSVGEILKRQQEGYVGEDSTQLKTIATFASTREVFQTSRFTNSQELVHKAEEKDHTYLKSPSGIFTTFAIPYNQIFEQHKGDTLNSVKVTFNTYTNKKEGVYSMEIPSTMMLIRKSEMYSFFEENRVTDDITSYLATYDSSNNRYKFENLLPLVKTCINEKEEARKEAGANWDEAAWIKENEDWDQIVLIPVTVSIDTNQNITSISHNLKPEYVKLRGGDKEKVTLSVVSTHRDRE